MKKILLPALIMIVFASKASAQSKGFTMADFKANIGKTGTLCDTVYSYKAVSDTLTLLNLGAAYPRQKYTIAIKGNKIKLDLSTIKGKHVCATGTFEFFKGQPEIVADKPEQITVN
ncbi:hypothetical protein ACRQ5D_06175 [Mucilaginibacter sp. P25]|uniref:Uncharacterized protein n=1 Tax=Mucilaginibacter gossypii TaxID=551996 RepID=A0A1G7XVZ6_9SPHI|nr:hypothetical protein [Mucilaginibacter gossypii]SDG88367.1 hypothetical protein SAMN05192573_105192 [Mucilaginibacter gossypii]